MAQNPAARPDASNHTICLPISHQQYETFVDDPQHFRQWLQESFQQTPELFPASFDQGFVMKDRRTSKKLNLTIRRIQLRDGSSWSIRPSLVTPSMTAYTDEVEKPLFLRKFGVPYWALTHVFGRNSMFWYRLEMALGRNSIVGTTVRRKEIPKNLLADEHHQTCRKQKVYVACTIGEGCWLGADTSATANTDDLQEAYDVFRQEARQLEEDYTPESVNTDGWKSTRAAWKALFPGVTLVLCFLHAWLKIRDRGKQLKEVYFEVSKRVWEIYHASTRRSFSQRIRRLRSWAESHLSGVVLEKTIDLCNKREQWSVGYTHPKAHRTSNMLDRLMRGMNRCFESSQRLHGKEEASRLRCRSWALLWNFAPMAPNTKTDKVNPWRSPAERLNQHRYHDNWLQNLFVSASCGGYKHPQNP